MLILASVLRVQDCQTSPRILRRVLAFAQELTKSSGDMTQEIWVIDAASRQEVLVRQATMHTCIKKGILEETPADAEKVSNDSKFAGQEEDFCKDPCAFDEEMRMS